MRLRINSNQEEEEGGREEDHHWIHPSFVPSFLSSVVNGREGERKGGRQMDPRLARGFRWEGEKYGKVVNCQKSIVLIGRDSTVQYEYIAFIQKSVTNHVKGKSRRLRIFEIFIQ